MQKHMKKKTYSTVVMLLLACSSFLYTGFRTGNVFQVGIAGKQISLDMNPVNILYTFWYDNGHHSLLKLLFFIVAGILIYASSRYWVQKMPLLPLIMGICYSVAIEIENFCFSGLEICWDIGNWFIYLVGLAAGFWGMKLLEKCGIVRF